jgi:D-3-phosphoglycerate dehydrogenase
MRIVLCYPVEPRHCQEIAATAPGAEVVDAGQEVIAREILAADIFCGHPKVPMPWDEVVRRGRLRWIQSSAAGLDHCLVPPIVESEIIVTSASGVLSDQVAEHAMALCGGLFRGIGTFLAAQARREFIRRPTRDLHGATVGIVGFGGVGRRLAELLTPYRVRILATDWFPVDRPEWVEGLLPPERLAEVLPQVDVLFLCAPLTEGTYRMIDGKAMGQMKRGAMLINVARGGLVAEADLAGALKDGRLAGAALDVTEDEPPAANSPLWDAPNLILTPHVAGQSARRIDDMTAFFRQNLSRYLAGSELVNLVDKRLGFPIRRGRGGG